MPIASSKGTAKVESDATDLNSISSREPSTPQRARNVTTPLSSTSSSTSKRKRGETDSPSAARTKGSKWSVQEERVIKKSIAVNGEKGSNWYQILDDINAQRSAEDQRTIHGLRQHWAAMKVKWVDE